MKFTVRDELGNVVLDLTQSITKILGTISVSSSQRIPVAAFRGQRGWASVSSTNWSPGPYAQMCVAEVSGSEIVVTCSGGTHQITYGIY